MLRSVGLSSEEIEDVLHDSYSADKVRRDVTTASAQTVKYFRNIGALDHAAIQERFEEYGLLEQHSTQGVPTL
jgi:hypothetical protein